MEEVYVISVLLTLILFSDRFALHYSFHHNVSFIQKYFQFTVIKTSRSLNEIPYYSDVCIYWVSGMVQGSLNEFPDFFRMGTFIDSTHMKLWSPSKYSPLAAMHLLYHFNNFWKAPWKSSCVSVSMTFITASFISSIVS